MIKSIIKEIIIVLLLCVAILLVLGVLFYDYNPINKVVPNKIAYTAPENIRNELEENVQNNLSIENKVYTVEGADLNIYKKSKTYNPSKENPFASTTSGSTNVVTSGNNVNINTNEKQENTTTTNSNVVKTNTSNNNTSKLK